MERVLKTLVVIGLIVLYLQHLILPGLAAFDAERQLLVDLEGEVRRAGGDLEQTRRRLAFEREAIAARFARLDDLVPAFGAAPSQVAAKFEAVRAVASGAWTSHPVGAFTREGMLVRWPFRVRFTGRFVDALRGLAVLETAGVLARTAGLRLQRHGAPESNEVSLEATLELLFRATGNEADGMRRESVGLTGSGGLSSDDGASESRGGVFGVEPGDGRVSPGFVAPAVGGPAPPIGPGEVGG